MTDTQATQLIGESLSSLRRSGLIDTAIDPIPDTVLFGTGAVLDSMAFVGFVTDLEDRVSREAGQEWYLDLEEVHEWNPESQSGKLTIKALAGFLARARN